MLKMMRQIDRPTENDNLIYLKTVKPHKIVREDQLVDPYVANTLTEILGSNCLEYYKDYTRSFYTLEGHYKNLWLYDRLITSRPRSYAYETAVMHTRERFKLPTPATAYNWDEIGRVPFIPSTAAGWGYIGKKGDAGNHALAISKAVGNYYGWVEQQPTWRYTPDLAWTRTQLGTFENPKIRNVWGKAFHNILLEGLTAYPLIRSYQEWTNTPIVIGIHLYKRLPHLIHEVMYPENEENDINYGVGIDFKSFDSCPQPWLIEDGFNILRDNIIIKDKEVENTFRYTKEFFTKTPVIMPDGRLWLKQSGLPSGSYYTQLMGSVMNHIIITYIQLRYWGRPWNTYVLGDDSIFGLPVELGYPDLQQIAKYGQELGFTIHPDKVIVATRPDEMEFLGHEARGLRVDRDTAKMLRLALFSEHPVPSPTMSIARMKGLLIDSALNNTPLLRLTEYMIMKYRTEGGLEQHAEDKNWLNAVLGINLPPKDIDIVKAWTIT